ncbi:MAG TPA: protein kinase [Gemmatimonadales bacterium]|nr:protein kinase [Gemmatimonadales bacterium]
MTAPSELFARLQAALGSQYRLERELGHGGMGVVFLARDTTLDRPVAVKVVHPDLAVHASITQRFLAEARMIARLRHPSIVSIHTAGETTGVFYYVMDYVPGESLRQRLTREGRLPVEDVLRIVADLADALHEAGKAGLVHRDVKPENILLDQASGRAMLADFGIARAMATDADGVRTGQGVAVGTPTYMSPEQAAGDTVDTRSDLYALGVVAYEMLAGRPPFRGQTAAAVATMHLAERPQAVNSLRSGVPASLSEAIMRALAKDPKDRWQTGAEFREALLSERATVARASRRVSRRWVYALTGAGAAVALMVALAFRPSGPPRGVNPRHSILVLPFDNLRQDPTVDWLRDGSVNMLALNLSQWTDLTVVDHERLHDLFERRKLDSRQPVGLEMARRLARDAGVWTVALGDFTKAGDSLQLVARLFDVSTGNRLDVARVEGRTGDDVRPLFDRLAAQLLHLSGAPAGVRTDVARATTQSLEAYRAYLQGLEELNGWNLGAAERGFRRAVELDSSFGLAYYKLSLTRGWLAGQADSVGMDAIRRATLLSDRLPEHDRQMVTAYRYFLEGSYDQGEAAYRALLAHDSTDADAWYGLGDVTFHATEQARLAERYTKSIRAFRRAIALDPNYYLAYEHLTAIYRTAGQERPYLALLPGDSIIVADAAGKAPKLDSLRLAQAVQRARSDGIAAAREWLTHQPDNAHAQNALIYGYAVAKQYDAALAEVDRLARAPEGAGRADLDFIRTQLVAQQGDLKEATRLAAKALDSARADRFDAGRLPAFETLGEVSNGANLLAYSGKVALASRTLDLAAQIHDRWYPDLPGSEQVGDRSLYGHMLQSHLYTALGAPAAKLRPIWDRIADSARRAPKARRGSIAEYGWAAAVGLYLQDTTDPTPLNELSALGGGAPAPELKALVALERGDSSEARRLLQQSDSAMGKEFMGRAQWYGYRQMIAAHAWTELGDDQRALKALEIFEPAKLSTGGLDIRWLLLGQARVLRGEIYERLGRPAEARDQYKLALAQWADADPVLEEMVSRVRARLDRLTGQG